MSIRETSRKMTGRLSFQPEVVLGFRRNGERGVTVHVNYDSYGCYDSPEVLRRFIDDLEIAYWHLIGEEVIETEKEALPQ